MPLELRQQFDENGFIVVRDFLPEDAFRRLQEQILDSQLACREHRQGDTITRRVAVGSRLLASISELEQLIDSQRWKGIMAYVSSFNSEPLYYIQTIDAGRLDAEPDPQVQLHADTFHPTLKAWLFLTDVGPDDRPLTYVAGSHRLSEERQAWEKSKSAEVVTSGDRLSQRGSLRIRPDELAELNLPPPTQFAVPANTLVAADTCGFHARGSSDRPTLRVELWAFSRRSPFIPWTGFDLLSWRHISRRRTEWLGPIVDWLAQRGLMVQHWSPAGRQRPVDPSGQCQD